MTSLKGLINAARSGDQLIVTGPHYEWMERLETEQVPSQAAVAHALRAYMRAYKRPRSGRFSMSGIGGCTRALALGYAGAPQKGIEAGLQEIMDHGTTDHLRWQMEGLTLGYMKEAEKWVYDDDLRVGGSIDAELSNGDVFELKSAAPSVYRRIVDEQRYPKPENIAQGDGYMWALDAPYMSLVYADRSYGNFHEFRIARDATRERELLRRLRSLNRYVDEDDLPPMLPDCEIKWGKTYKECFFRQVCPTVHTITQAQDAGNPAHDSGLQIAPGAEQPKWVTQVLEILEGVSDD